MLRSPFRSVWPAARLAAGPASLLLAAAGAAALLASGCAPAGAPTAPRQEAPAPRRATPAPLAATAGAPATGALDRVRDAYVRRHFIRGLTRAQLDDWPGAVRHYEQALEAAPETPALLSALAEAERAQGALSTALYHAEQARRLAPATPHYHRQLARLYQQAEQPRAALRAYEKLLERFPGDGNARLAYARLQAEEGHREAALRSYERLAGGAQALPPARLPEMLTEMLALYRAAGHTRGIERTLRALVRQAPRPGEHRLALARFYQEQGRAGAALPVLETAAKQSPGHAEATSLLAEAYRAAGRAEDAAALQRRGATLGEGTPGKGMPGKRAPGEGSDDTAEALVRRARPLVQRARQKQKKRGDAQEEEGAARAATRLLEDALQQDSTHAEALALLGALRFDAGAFAEAAGLLRRALEGDPRAPARWARAAEAYLEAGQPGTAAAVADEGLLLFPGQVPLLQARAAALVRMGRDAEAQRHLEEALRVMETDGWLDNPAHAAQAARLHAALARLHDRQGRPERARQHRAQAAAFRDRLNTTSN